MRSIIQIMMQLILEIVVLIEILKNFQQRQINQIKEEINQLLQIIEKCKKLPLQSIKQNLLKNEITLLLQTQENTMSLKSDLKINLAPSLMMTQKNKKLSTDLILMITKQNLTHSFLGILQTLELQTRPCLFIPIGTKLSFISFTRNVETQENFLISAFKIMENFTLTKNCLLNHEN